MSDPVSATVILAAASAASKLISGGISALGHLRAGSDAKRAAQIRARALDAAALQDRTEAGVEAGIALEEADRVSAHAAVTAAANGGGLGGSAGAVLDDLSRQAVFNARSIIYRGETAARNRVYEGQVARQEGKNAKVQSRFAAAGSLLGGAAGAADSYTSFKAASAGAGGG